MFSEDLLHIDIREKAYFYNNLLGETCCDWILIYKCDFFCGWFLTLKNYLLSDLNFYAYLLAGISSRAGFIGSKKHFQIKSPTIMKAIRIFETIST